MKNSYALYFVATVLFAIASVLGFINGSGARSVIAALLAISMLLAGIHYLRKSKQG